MQLLNSDISLSFLQPFPSHLLQPALTKQNIKMDCFLSTLGALLNVDSTLQENHAEFEKCVSNAVSLLMQTGCWQDSCFLLLVCMNTISGCNYWRVHIRKQNLRLRSARIFPPCADFCQISRCNSHFNWACKELTSTNVPFEMEESVFPIPPK